MTAIARIRQALRWLGTQELGVLVSLIVAAGGVWVFVELADEVVEGSTQRFDTLVLLAMRTEGDPADPLGPRWFEEMVRDITALGGSAVLILLTLTVIGFLVIQHDYRTAVFVTATVISAQIVSLLLKQGFARPRPELLPHYTYVYTSSFPSGHAMLSAAVYMTLGAMLAGVQERTLLKAYLLLCALFTTIAVGLSRIYMGVHWPTDVLGGWAAGGAWAALWWVGARAYDRRAGNR